MIAWLITFSVWITLAFLAYAAQEADDDQASAILLPLAWAAFIAVVISWLAML